MTRSEIIQWQQQYSENAYYYRGKLIDTFNTLEKTIENYICGYFGISNSKVIEFCNVVLDRLTFESKKACFLSLMNAQSENKGFIKTKNNSWPNSKLFKQLNEAQDERNAFAHYYLSTPGKDNGTIISLIEYRDKGETHGYTQKEYDAILNRISKCTEEIFDLYLNLPERFQF
jgi:hypothetical protein